MWISLGVVTLDDYEWKVLDPPLVYGLGFDSGLFRISQSWEANLNPVGKAWLASYYPDEDLYTLFRSFKPNKESDRLIEAPVPQSYIQARLQERIIIVKADNRTRWYSGSDWKVHVQYYQPDTITEEEQAFQKLLSIEAGISQLEARITQIQASLN